MNRPLSLREVADRRAAFPEAPLYVPLGEFLDAFYDEEAPLEGMLADEPVAAIAPREAAYLAAVADHLSALHGLATPAWTAAPSYFLSQAYWVGDWGANSRAICLAESPTAFRRRFIFTEGRPLRRKNGPRIAAAISPADQAVVG